METYREESLHPNPWILIYFIWFLLIKFSKSKISYFSSSTFHKYICSFDISVTNTDLSQIFQSLINISNNISKLSRVQRFFLFNDIFKVAFLAKFCYNVTCSIWNYSLVEFDYVWMPHFFQDFYFLKNKSFKVLWLQLIKFNNLYGNCLFFFNKIVLEVVLKAL